MKAVDRSLRAAQNKTFFCGDPQPRALQASRTTSVDADSSGHIPQFQCLTTSDGLHMPFALTKRLASSGPISLIDLEDIDCACVLAIAGLVDVQYPQSLAPGRQLDASPITVLGLTPRGVRLAMSRSFPRKDLDVFEAEQEAQ